MFVDINKNIIINLFHDYEKYLYSCFDTTYTTERTSFLPFFKEALNKNNLKESDFSYILNLLLSELKSSPILPLVYLGTALLCINDIFNKNPQSFIQLGDNSSVNKNILLNGVKQAFSLPFQNIESYRPNYHLFQLGALAMNISSYNPHQDQNNFDHNKSISLFSENETISIAEVLMTYHPNTIFYFKKFGYFQDLSDISTFSIFFKKVAHFQPDIRKFFEFSTSTPYLPIRKAKGSQSVNYSEFFLLILEHASKDSSGSQLEQLKELTLISSQKSKISSLQKNISNNLVQNFSKDSFIQDKVFLEILSYQYTENLALIEQHLRKIELTTKLNSKDDKLLNRKTKI